MKRINNFLGYTVIFFMLTMGCKQGAQKAPGNFDKYPVYTGADLEINWTPQQCNFRVWSPSADEVKVLIYDQAIGGSSIWEKKMKKDVDGTWTVAFDENLKGKFYTFRIKYHGDWLDETPGIYAKAVGVNGMRAAIIDMEETNPEGWEFDTKPALNSFNDIVIYELHVRDISIHPGSGIQHKGKFIGLAEEGTQSTEGEKTGIEHFEELGITHIHLLPSFDYQSIDEMRLDENRYNWGYDPENYNVPEGSYASNPKDPETRILEFKQMVQALHRRGIRVIMDVVYNHTGKTDNSNFNLLVPGYFYRFNQDGSYSNASGCGNETASERPMVRRYIIESLKHWVNEYHIDGFRFDLMGIHDIETMNQISQELHAIDPTIFIYGEGWTAGGSPLPENQQALKKYTHRLDSIAAFSDDIRDAIKGSWSDHASKGFVSGAQNLEESIKFGVVASTKHPQIDYSKVNYSKEPWAAEPYQTISYVSCHDNHTLLDKLKISNPDDTEEELIKKHKLANTIVLTSQGVPFLHAGVDFLRTKQGVENSYNSPDSINQIDWSRKHFYRDVFDYYQDLVSLRKEHPAFRMTSTEQIVKHLEFLNPEIPGVVAFVLKNSANGDSWKNIVVIYNSTKEEQTIKIPGGSFQEVFNETGKARRNYRLFRFGKATVAPVSALVIAEF